MHIADLRGAEAVEFDDFFWPGETTVKLCFKFLLPPTDGQYTL
jgi:hypothetical protein